MDNEKTGEKASGNVGIGTNDRFAAGAVKLEAKIEAMKQPTVCEGIDRAIENHQNAICRLIELKKNTPLMFLGMSQNKAAELAHPHHFF